MGTEHLKMNWTPALDEAQMVLGFSGWMDGGEVSTGAVDYLVKTLQARRFGGIANRGFYIYNFPGSMDIAALFRPHTEIEGGLVTSYQEPRNRFFVDESKGLVLFSGKEPNLGWHDFADCIFGVAEQTGVRRILFIGSVSGAVPHTRAPRFHASVSEEHLLGLLERHGIEPSNYEGPASFITHLLRHAPTRDIELVSLVAEVPAYVQGRNVKAMEATVRKLAAILHVPIAPHDLKILADAFERRVKEMVGEREELRELVEKMEADYDREVRDSHMAGLEAWFEKQNIRLD